MPPHLSIIQRAEQSGAARAVVDETGEFTYRELLADSASIADHLLNGRSDLGEQRVAFLARPGYEYVVALWGIWRAGGVAVPLAESHPEPEVEYSVRHSEASIILADESYAERLKPIANARDLTLATIREAMGTSQTRRISSIDPKRRALILFTSGSTGRPKGVVWTHAGIGAQVSVMSTAWGWTGDDRVLSILPLHHIHGLFNVVTTALWNGATCEFVPKFDARLTWRRLASGEISVFMAVPTIYVKLIKAWNEATSSEQRRLAEGAKSLRLMVSGSAALAIDVFHEWREITRHTLLERYGMTEIGMAISNPLAGPRMPGYVGQSLAGVEVRLVDDLGRTIDDGSPGEIEVRGSAMFLEYWSDPNATAEARHDGWFRTGDVAILEDGRYRILGRQSVDIIKTGGYKVSALEIESAFASHPDVEEVAVVGLPDDEWGERVAAAIVPRAGATLNPKLLKTWGRQRLAPYKVPSDFCVVSRLPRNAMGKIVKPSLAAELAVTLSEQARLSDTSEGT